jgi:hypothetical protein
LTGGLQPQGTAVMFLLLEQRSVQQELRASEDQVKQARAAAGALRIKLEELRNLPIHEAFSHLGEIQESAEGELQTILSREQYLRLREIGLQQVGPLALGRRDVAEALALTADQQSQIRLLLEQLVVTVTEGLKSIERPKLGGGPLRTGLLDGIARAQSAKRDTETKILALLTADQKAKWTAIQGAPFTGALRLAPMLGR